MHDVTVIGGGIVGLSVAMAVQDRFPGAAVAVLEKEDGWARHQTGNNSGVIHSGLYYQPGSLKAQLCRAGNRSIVAFCQEHGIPYDVCGKVVVATDASELAGLEALYERGTANGLEIDRLGPDGVRDLEPHVRCVAGLHVPATGITDFGAVTRAYAEVVAGRGGDLRTGTRVERIEARDDGAAIHTTAGTIDTRVVVNCAGLQSDRVAHAGGVEPGARIMPFRGEYYELAEHARGLVRNLVYPVPNPDFPFLGVHFTRAVDGRVHAGPNAVPGLAREGYRKRDISLRDTAEILGYPGFWHLAARHGREGLKEIHRSFSKRAFVRSLQRLVPDITAADLEPGHAGVRAQALRPDGGLVDDFLVVRGPSSVHVCNAPSPAATSSLEIGRAVAAELPSLGGRPPASPDQSPR